MPPSIKQVSSLSRLVEFGWLSFSSPALCRSKCWFQISFSRPLFTLNIKLISISCVSVGSPLENPLLVISLFDLEIADPHTRINTVNPVQEKYRQLPILVRKHYALFCERCPEKILQDSESVSPGFCFVFRQSTQLLSLFTVQGTIRPALALCSSSENSTSLLCVSVQETVRLALCIVQDWVPLPPYL